MSFTGSMMIQKGFLNKDSFEKYIYFVVMILQRSRNL